MSTMTAREWHQWRDRYYAKKPNRTSLGKTFAREHAKDLDKHSELVNANDRAAEQYIEERFIQF